MRITLAVLFLAGLTIYCKCAAELSLPPSPLIAHAASVDESLNTQKAFVEKYNEAKRQQLLAHKNEGEPKVRALATDSYKNFKNLWHNDLSLNLQKREQRYTFDVDDDVAAMQQFIAPIKKNNQNQNSLQPHDNENEDDNIGHKNYNFNNDNKNEDENENENNILKSSATSFLPLLQSSADTILNKTPQLQFSSQKVYDDHNNSNELLSSSPEMIDYIFVSPPHQIQVPLLHTKRRELENVPTAAAAAVTEDSPYFNRFLKSTKYWSRQCTLENENNCLQEYYGALIADRNTALLKQLQQKPNYPSTATEETNSLNNNNDINDDDIVLLLTAEHNLKQFLRWALSELYSYGKLGGDIGTDIYHPGMYMWRKLNLSPLFVQEPHYVLMRRENDRAVEAEEDIDDKRGFNYGEDPFIPPRGRKHNLPDLDSLLQRYETFVPNRGRRDKIKDFFINDDLFYPNRGKRQMTTAANVNGDTNERNDNTDIKNIKEIQHFVKNEETAERLEMQHPLLSIEQLMEYIENLITKMKRKLHQKAKQQHDEKLANSFDEMSNRNEPTTRMSSTYQQGIHTSTTPSLLKKRLKSMINILYNHKKPQQQQLPNLYNAKRQWGKRYTAAKASLAKSAVDNENPMPAIRTPAMLTNRLQTTTLRSMSPPIQSYQPDQQQTDFSPSLTRSDNNNKFMWQQLPKSMKSLALHFDPLSKHKLQLLLQHQQQPPLTRQHPRLTALQHLAAALQQQTQPQLKQLATPPETQLTYSYDQFDNSLANDLD